MTQRNRAAGFDEQVAPGTVGLALELPLQRISWRFGFTFQSNTFYCQEHEFFMPTYNLSRQT